MKRFRVPVWLLAIPVVVFVLAYVPGMAAGSLHGPLTPKATAPAKRLSAPPGPPSQVFEMGQEYRANGIGVTVDRPLFEERSFLLGRDVALRVRVRIANYTSENRVARITSGGWFAVDDQAVKHEVGVPVWPGRLGEWNMDLLKANSSETLEEVWIGGAIEGFRDVQQLWIVIPEVSQLRNGVWKVDVPH